MTDTATRAQNDAADPRFSTWLSANAGSGKTRVLTDRVARLLLSGTQPQNILCLTYTKAAASEMQNRLFRRLGAWAMMPDAELRKELSALGETPPSSLDYARTLFARAIDTPGGLKIQTIHSFCSSILRQFPLEAGVSPAFREIDDAQQRRLVEVVLDDLGSRNDPTLAAISRCVDHETMAALALSISRQRASFSERTARADIFERCGVHRDLTVADIVQNALNSDDMTFFRNAAAVLAQSEKTTDIAAADHFGDLGSAPSLPVLESLESRLLTGPSAASPFTARIGAFPTKGMREGLFAPLVDRMNDIMVRVEAARRLRIGLLAAEKNAALCDFAGAFLDAYSRAKDDAGVLDFDDLIERASRLLTTRSLEWVLYRLDGGIDHILVDEAQDTSPQQWQVIDALAREITAGHGRDARRTLFVVGDKKQSIYSFQGADAREFDRMHQVFGETLKNGPSLQSHELLFSFRSSSAILSVVDSVFDEAAGSTVGSDVRHRAFHDTLPGRVDLWPLMPRPDKVEMPAWHDPVDRMATNDPKILLADGIAGRIKEMIGKDTIPGENGVPRHVRAGDFLVLVQRRSDLFDHIIRACKEKNLPIAGADRLKIGAELAVKDLLALLNFLALQEDDLSLAASLRSPLFGWSESDLYDLAEGRARPYLWAELRGRREEFAETHAALTDLLRQVDFKRPYELLEYILTAMEGRRKLLARLGNEAEDGIDELLNQALSYERDSVPSLTGFLTRAQSEDIEIKRQSDGSGNLIRVMTVHGAKGLEAPIVILPDTTVTRTGQRNLIVLDETRRPMWRLSRAECPDTLRPVFDADSAADSAERERLLYVAMTRAETWLIVCGAESGTSGPNWYAQVSHGLERLDTEEIDTPTGRGRRFAHGKWPATVADAQPEIVTEPENIPDFLTRPAPAPARDGQVLSPSDLGGEKATPGGALSEEMAKRYGRQLHRLLEHLPRFGSEPADAERILKSGPDPVLNDVSDMYREAVQVIDRHPRIFRSDALAEVDISAILPTLGSTVAGTIDRLIVEPDTVTAIDFKSNFVVPADPEAVPEGILRQMGAYLEALAEVFPDHGIRLFVIWTRTAELMELPHAIVRKALSRATTS